MFASEFSHEATGSCISEEKILAHCSEFVLKEKIKIKFNVVYERGVSRCK